MKKYIIATIKTWNIENCRRLQKKYTDSQFVLVTTKEELQEALQEKQKPEYIFFPHWSWMIPEEIFNSYECVVFHSTDLPFGRGGSPIQNLIIRGIYNTKISAIKVCKDVDAGPIYMKKPVCISEGNVDDILKRISDIIFNDMIPRFLNNRLIPEKQVGEVVCFNRRKPEESKIPDGLNQRQLYDYIRMLDGEGYPPAYREYGNGKLVFSDAEISDNLLCAKVQYIENV